VVLITTKTGKGSDGVGIEFNMNLIRNRFALNVVGGFLEGCVQLENGESVLYFRHYNPDGLLLNEYKIPNHDKNS